MILAATLLLAAHTITLDDPVLVSEEGLLFGNGDYHSNYNYQSIYWGGFAVIRQSKISRSSSSTSSRKYR